MNHTLDHLLAFHCGPTLAGRRAASFSGLTIAGRLQGVDALADRMRCV